MKKLSGTDASFLYNETIAAPQHVGSIQYLEVEQGQTTFFADLRELVLSRIHLLPYLTSRLEFMPWDVDHPIWVRHTEFDIDTHLHHVHLDNASRDELEKLCAELYEPALDRSKPLWEMYVIEGLASGEIAVMAKTHHACVDGMASVAAVEILGDVTPAPLSVEPPAPGFWDADTSTPFDRWRESWVNLAKYQIDAQHRWPEAVAASLREQARQLGNVAETPVDAPSAPWNGSITAKRSIAGSHFSLSTLKAIGRATGTKINDVVLAITSEALNRYCTGKNVALRESLIAGCPVSLRRPGDQSMNNQVTMMTVSLENGVRDIVDRLNAIRASSTNAKERLNELGANIATDFGAPFMPAQMQAFSASPQLAWASDWNPRVPMNLVVSNVPGPRETLYSAGARVVGSTPLSIVMHGAGLNVTVASYVDRMDLGLTAATKLVPDVGVLRDHFDAVYAELIERVLDDDATDTAPAQVAA